MAALPGLVTNLANLIKDAFAELQGAGVELNENNGKSEEIKAKCQENKAESPKECYLTCGKPIPPPAKGDKKQKKKPKKGAKGNANQNAKK
jgi:hypothetical protein